jgi:hypothetical protein
MLEELHPAAQILFAIIFMVGCVATPLGITMLILGIIEEHKKN